MVVYADLAIVLNFIVDLCLMLGANRLCGHGSGWKRALPAAALGSVYAAVCLLPGFGFLGNFLWRIVILIVMSFIAFGGNFGALQRGIVFVLLSMALGGIALGIDTSGFLGLAAAAGIVCLLCFAGFRFPLGKSRFVPVTLCYHGKKLSLTALLDTGNLLHDPISGQPILLVGADVGMQIPGLTPKLLADPVTAMTDGSLPGARLIPYRSVGKSGGMLLALRMDEVWIDEKRAGDLVAFAPDILCGSQTYQALTGGVV